MTAEPHAQTIETTASPSATIPADASCASVTTPAPPPSQQSQPLSKNAQKKLAKATRMAEQKKDRRAYEKEKKKEKKRELAAKRAAGELDGDEQPRKKSRTEGPRTPFQARIIVDLGFDDLMTENEVKSLTNQLGYTYNANKKASHPFAALLYTSLGGRTHTRLESMSDAGYRRWRETEWWHEGYERLWERKTEEKATAVSDEKASEQGAGDREREKNTLKLQKNPQTASRESVIYLTADSTYELTELKEGETYIIGGIVDHNRYKNLCLNKAEASHIRTARLPIGTYLAELKTRKVLTVNQTFEILLEWVETRDWKTAFEQIIPKRKFNEKGKDSRRGSAARGSQQPETGDGQDHAELDSESRRVILDALALDDEEMREEVENDEVTDADVEAEGGEMSISVAAPQDTEITTENGLAITMVDAHLEVSEQPES